MIILVIQGTPEKESGQKALGFESYYSFKLPGDPLRALQN